MSVVSGLWLLHAGLRWRWAYAQSGGREHQTTSEHELAKTCCEICPPCGDSCELDCKASFCGELCICFLCLARRLRGNCLALVLAGAAVSNSAMLYVLVPRLYLLKCAWAVFLLCVILMLCAGKLCGFGRRRPASQRRAAPRDADEIMRDVAELIDSIQACCKDD